MTQLSKKAKISEVFSSIQGEGVYQGIRQVFVRFYGCNLNCDYCDTKLTHFDKYSALELYNLLSSFKNYHSACLTGGEPLLQTDFLEEFLKFIKLHNIAVYLETNGTLFKELTRIIDYIDIVAMDFKLPSSNQGRNFWESHRKFMQIAAKKDFLVKIVIAKNTKNEEIDKAIDLLSEFNYKDRIKLVLQPNYFELDRKLMDKVSGFQIQCLERVKDVRIVPQMHKLLKIK
jgi:organic radical activating enzyme